MPISVPDVVEGGNTRYAKEDMQDCVRETVGWSEYSFVHVPGQSGWEQVATRPDGKTYYREFHELMEACVVQSELVTRFWALF